MKNISPKQRILEHIDNVRDWLNRAEDGYQRGASVQGEMNLNLAQAELKKAWEESREMNREAQTSEKVVSLAYRKQAQAVPLPADGVNKRRHWLVQHRFGLVAAVALLLMINLVPLFHGLPLTQRVGTDADPVTELPMGVHLHADGFTQAVQLVAGFGDAAAHAEKYNPDGSSLTSADRAETASRQRPGSVNRQADTPVMAAKQADPVKADTAAEQSMDAEKSFRLDGKKGQTTQTPAKEVRGEEKDVTSVNRSIALNAKSLRSGNRVDTLFTSGTTGTVQVFTDSTPARSSGSGLAMTATDAVNNAETRTGDTKDANLALSTATVSAEEMSINANKVWAADPSFDYMAYSLAARSSSQNTQNGTAGGVRTGSTAASAAVVTFDFDALIDLATQALYTNQQ